MEQPDATERAAARAAGLLTRRDAFLEADAQGYAVRLSTDRRRRPALVIDEAAFVRLVEKPGLRQRTQGGWTLRTPPPSAPDTAARPATLSGERAVMDEAGRLVVRRANLGESPLAWLARRRDGTGQPWLTRAEVLAGERLREAFYRGGDVGRLTMDWSGRPRGPSGGATLDPAERGMAARARVRSALDAVGPGLCDILERVCLAGTALDAAERGLGLPRRSGKTLLKLALGRLATHYRIG